MGDWRDPDLDHLERHLEHELVGRGMTRAELVAGGGRLAAALGLGWLYQATIGSGAAFAAADRATGATKFTGTLKVMGMGTDLIEPVRQEAEKDLGFELRRGARRSHAAPEGRDAAGRLRRLLGRDCRPRHHLADRQPRADSASS